MVYKAFKPVVYKGSARCEIARKSKSLVGSTLAELVATVEISHLVVVTEG